MAFKTLIAGVDGSESSLRAVGVAADLARKTDAKLVLVSAYLPPDKATLERWKREAPAEAGHLINQSAVAQAVLEKAASGLERVAVTTRAEQGDPADVLISVAEEIGADLIVVGNRGMTGARRFVLGSVPNKVSHHAGCHVLIVKTV